MLTLPDAAAAFGLGLMAAAGVAALARHRVGRREGALDEELRGWRNRQAALDEELRGWRDRQAALDAISDVWRWQTDASHRLVALHAPAGRPSADIDDALFWERFGAARSSGLEERMRSGMALDDIDLDAGPGHEQIALRLRGRPLRDAAGAFSGYVGTLREVAAEPRTAPQSDPAVVPAAPRPSPGAPPDEGEHEALGTLVSHDLRAPIRVVEGFTRIVKEDYAHVLDALGHDHLDRVLGAAGRMNHMIDALLALSRLATQPIARVPVDLSQLAGYVVEDLRRLRPDPVVEVAIEPGMTAAGDPTLLRMVLENLLGNAWKYTGHSPAPKVSFRRDRDAADTFVVSDNGAGFDMRYADRLFGVFQRLHSASEFPGTGVGLASVRRIVRRHGGEIRAEGEPDRGASFYFSLPAPAAEA